MKKLPLGHLRVLDLTHLLPGPLLTMMMADLGAEVIKIEKPPHGDLNRRVTPYLHGMSTYFLMLNRNKKNKVLDLKSPAGKKTFLALVQTSDVLIENFRPGTMKRLGLDYESLKKINPKLIYCAISGYGQHSPWKNKAGHDLNYVALSGLLSATGHVPTAYPHQRPPVGRPAMLSTQLADIVGGSFMGMISIMAALAYRQKNKTGMFIDCSMLAGTMVLQMMILGKFLATGEEPYQENDRMTGRYPNYMLYETKDHRYMAVAAIEPKFWNRFCEIIRRPEFKAWVPLSDKPGFPTALLAKCSEKKLKAMKQKLQIVFLKKTQKEWVRLFKHEADACCTPVQTMGEAVKLLKILGSKDLFYIKDKKGNRYPQWCFPFGNPKLSRKRHSLPPKML